MKDTQVLDTRADATGELSGKKRYGDQQAAPEEGVSEEAALRAREKRQQAEWKKTAKELKAKDSARRVSAIEYCAANWGALVEGGCLAPLLSLCVASKKNKDVVGPALRTARCFAEATTEVDPAEETRPHGNARLIFEALEKKSNKLPGGRLVSDLFRHEDDTIVADALALFECLVKALDDSAKKSRPSLLCAGEPVLGLAHVLDKNKPTDEPTEDESSQQKKAEAALSAFTSLKWVLEADQTFAEALVAAGAVPTLAEYASVGTPPAALGLLRSLVVGTTIGGTAAISLAESSAASKFLRRLETTSADGLELDPSMLEPFLAVAEVVFQHTPAENTSIRDSAVAALNAALAALLRLASTPRDEASGHNETENDVLAEATRRAAGAVVSFVGVFGSEPLLATSIPATILQIMAADVDARAALDAAAHQLVPYVSLVEGPLTAADLVDALSVNDLDSKYRAVRLIHDLAIETPTGLEALIEPLLRILQAWTAEFDAGAASDLEVGLDAAAIYAVRALTRLAIKSPASLEKLVADESTAVLDAAFAKPPDFGAEKIRGRLETTVRAAVADLLAVLARPSDDDAIATEATAVSLLALMAVDVQDGQYWGSWVPSLDDDLHRAAVDLACALASSEKGRTALVAAASKGDDHVCGSGDTATGEDLESDDAVPLADPLASPADAVDPLTNGRWRPYARVLALPVAVLATPGASAERLLESTRLVAALTRDPRLPASDQPADVDRFAAAFVAAGGLVSLAAAASPRTVLSCVALFGAAEEKQTTACSSAAAEAVAAEATALAAELARRASARRARLEANGASAGAAAAAEKLAELEANFKEEARLAEEAAAKKKGGAAGSKKKEDVGGEADEDGAEALQKREALEAEERDKERRAQALAHGRQVESRDAVDSRGPTVETWADLISRPGDDSRRRSRGSTPLLAALAGGAASAAVAAALLDAGARVDVTDSNGTGPLARALSRGSAEAAADVLARGADVDAVDGQGAPVLQYAVLAPSPEALDAALKEATEHGWSPDHPFALGATLQGSGRTVDALLDAGADVDVADGRGKFPLHWAVEGVSTTLSYDGGVRCVLQSAPSSGLLAQFLQRGAKIDACDPRGTTPLHAALFAGRADLASILLRAGARPNVYDSSGRLPLHVACARMDAEGGLDMVAELLEKGPAYPIERAFFDEERAKASKAEKKRLDVSAVLRRAYDAALRPTILLDTRPSKKDLLSYADTSGRTPLHCAAGALLPEETLSRQDPEGSKKRSAGLAAVLAFEDVDPELQNKPCPSFDGASVLHLAVRTMADLAVPALAEALKKGALLDQVICCPSDDPELEVAAHSFQECVVVSPETSFSSRCVPAPHLQDESPAPSASFSKECVPTPDLPTYDDANDLSMVVVEAPAPAYDAEAPAPAYDAGPPCVGAPTMVSQISLAPLHFAVVKDAAEAARWLVARGASVNPPLSSISPLSLAALRGAKPATVRAVLDACEPGAGCAPAEDLGGLSPVHVAASRGHAETLEALFGDGSSSPDPVDPAGRTPLLLATLAGEEAAVRVLVRAGADVGRRDAGCRGPLDAAIDACATNLADVLLDAPQTNVDVPDLVRAERVHVDAAVAFFGLEPADRPDSERGRLLDSATAILKKLQTRVVEIPDDTHVDPCFAQGLLYSDVLLEAERREAERRERELAALRLQTIARQRAAQKQVKKKKKKASKKSKKNKKKAS